LNRETITLGSLFDGIGAFPLAASYFGIKPLWASEILPNAVSITRRHFPEMEHLGDVTKLHGGEIPPVHIITFGSPCQSFSVAGNRDAFNGKSGLFFEAIRIIREMRSATHGKYPEIVCFENVPGLLSVDGRRSYKTVLEAFCEAEIPMPRSGRWANAGMVRGRGIDLAWIIKDAAQHFRVPQRRKRLFLVADFTERRCAGQILFISQSLSGYFAARERERQGTPAATQGGSGGTGGDVTATASMAGQEENARCEPQMARTLTARGDSSPGTDRGQNVVAIEAHPKVAGTLCASGAGLSRPAGMASELDLCVAYPLQPIPIHDKATRYRGGGPTRKNDGAGNGLGIGKSGQPAPTMTAGDRHAIAAVDCRNLRENGNISGTLQSKNTGGYSLSYQNPIRMGYILRRLTPTEAERLMSLPDGWTEYGHDGKIMSDSARYQMCGNSIVVNVLAYIMQNIAGILSRDGG
jgi:DNA (cytosine-5)-methyltransferase 1